MDIQDKAIAQAIRLLKAAKAQYIIVTANGEQHAEGTLQLAEAKKPHKRVQVVPMGFYKAIYGDHIMNMVPGDVWTYTCPPEIDVDGLRSAVSSECTKRFGAGTCMTSIDKTKRTVQALRVE